MTDMPSIAQTVYYRHPCDCPTASRPLAPGQQPEHRFDIDGQPFPWYITTNGATFTHTLSGIYLVRCTIIPVRTSNGEPIALTLIDYTPPALDGQPFPWLITNYSITIDSAMPLLTVDIIAEHIDTDTEIQQEADT